MPDKKFTLGTRGSLLAITQAQQVLDQLYTNDQLDFEVKKIKTQGDQIVDKPLWQLDGKDFFTKELDEQLLGGSIDFVIHSYKDLGSDRPEGIKLAAITQRKFPQDIFLIRKEVLKEKPTNFIVGTSSPRRTVNLKHSLLPFIPWEVNNLEIKNLRGNVNTRIEKLISGEYDAIVLAFAGIERLAKNKENHSLIQEYFSELNYMVMPISEFPTAAAQGALAIEIGPKCPEKLVSSIKKLHCEKTAREVKWEKAKFKTYGGGCHLPMGITALEINNKLWTLAKGKESQEAEKFIIEGESFVECDIKKIASDEKLFIGLPKEDLAATDPDKVMWDEIYQKNECQAQSQSHHLYITSKYVLHAINKDIPPKTKWCAGVKSWLRLAQQGEWVNGCSDQFGESHLIQVLKSSLLQLIHGKNFQKNIEVMTNDEAPINFGTRLTCYKRNFRQPTDSHKEKLVHCKHFYWTSFSQYLAYSNAIPEIKEATHYCGLGKSSERFEDAGINVNKIRTWKELIK